MILSKCILPLYSVFRKQGNLESVRRNKAYRPNSYFEPQKQGLIFFARFSEEETWDSQKPCRKCMQKHLSQVNINLCYILTVLIAKISLLSATQSFILTLHVFAGTSVSSDLSYTLILKEMPFRHSTFIFQYTCWLSSWFLLMYSQVSSKVNACVVSKNMSWLLNE